MYLSDFIKDESGVETMEWIAILTVVAILIVIVKQIAETVSEKTQNLADSI